MAEQASDEAGRLEAALERIARAAPQGGRAQPDGERAFRGEVEHEAEVQHAALAPAADTQALAARLDALIAELRAILGQP